MKHFLRNMKMNETIFTILEHPVTGEEFNAWMFLLCIAYGWIRIWMYGID